MKDKTESRISSRFERGTSRREATSQPFAPMPLLSLFKRFITQSEVIWACFAPGSTARHPFFLSQHSYRCTSLRDLIKNTPLVKESRKRLKKTKNRHLNQRPPDYEACALLLCYNCCPQIQKIMYFLNRMRRWQGPGRCWCTARPQHPIRPEFPNGIPDFLPDAADLNLRLRSGRTDLPFSNGASPPMLGIGPGLVLQVMYRSLRYPVVQW